MRTEVKHAIMVFLQFVVTIIYYFAYRLLTPIRLHLFIVLCFLFACIVHNKLQVFSWGNIALGLVYYHLGACFKSWSTKHEAAQWIYFIIAAIVYVGIHIFDR